MNQAHIYPLGETALTVSFGNKISIELNDSVVRLAGYFEKHKFHGFIETIPAYCSLTIFYDVVTVRKNFPEFSTAFAAVKLLVENALASLGETKKKTAPRLVKIPICFHEEYAPDLAFVSEQSQLPKTNIIEIFTAETYRVFMLGFLPGFAYLGQINEKIAVPRRENPRLIVPKGSVGIAGRQTGIYPLESPGGWQLIGRTGRELFTPFEPHPTFLQAGDLVKFYAVDKLD